MRVNGHEHQRAECFSFCGCHFDPASGTAHLNYEVDGLILQEKITFPWAPWPVDASRQAAFLQALELLHLMAGVSYYKAGLARRIDTRDISIDTARAGFLTNLYVQGLGEFAYINQLDLTGLIHFEVSSGESSAAAEGIRVSQADASDSRLLDLPERALVAMGGGKDSLVCLQMLSDAGVEVQPACVGGSALIGETVKVAGLPLVRIQRELSPRLTEMNALGAWNGHVPVTAINSAILLCAGLLYGYRYIVFANESSANEPTLQDEQGKAVNHQYSKSLEFEKAYRAVIHRYVSPSIEYFSLLRPFSEIAIAQRFSTMKRYHSVFSSCNRNFHQDGSHIEGRWCQECPKCRFTALALAPFVSPSQLIAIQGTDILGSENQLQGFKALCGLGVHKPFECVGSIDESRAAIRYLSRTPQWQDKYIISVLSGYPEIMNSGELETKPDFAAPHCIPASIMVRFDAF